MTKELIGAAIMLGVIGICTLIGVLCKAFGECARDTAEFPDQHEGKEAKQ